MELHNNHSGVKGIRLWTGQRLFPCNLLYSNEQFCIYSWLYCIFATNRKSVMGGALPPSGLRPQRQPDFLDFLRFIYNHLKAFKALEGSEAYTGVRCAPRIHFSVSNFLFQCSNVEIMSVFPFHSLQNPCQPKHSRYPEQLEAGIQNSSPRHDGVKGE